MMSSAAMPTGSMPMGGMPGQMAMDDPFRKKKSPVGLIIGIVAGLAVVGGVAFFFMNKDPGAGGATPDQAAVSATPSAAPTPTTAPSPTQVAAVDTAAPATTGTPTAAGTEPGKTPPVGVGSPVPGTGPGPGTGPKTTPSATPSATPTAEPVKTAEPATPPPAEGGEFSRSAAQSALGSAAGAAKGCKKPDGPTGSGKVKVTFAPSGNVTSAQVEGPPFAGTAVGGCVASAFRSARVPPFSGPPVSVSKSFSIN
jgi:hypothetical protein